MSIVKPCGVCAYSCEPCANVPRWPGLSVSANLLERVTELASFEAFLTGSFSAVLQRLLTIEEREDCGYIRALFYKLLVATCTNSGIVEFYETS
jgi:hypothetical protein